MTDELDIDFDFADDDLDLWEDLAADGIEPEPEPEPDLEWEPPIMDLFDDPEIDPEENVNVRLGLGYRHDDHEPAPYTWGWNRRTVTG